MDLAERETLRTIADYQFGSGAGRALFPTDEAQTVIRTSSGRPQQITQGGPDGRRVVSYGIDGRFTLGIEGGMRLYAAIGRPTVELGEESVPFVRDEKNAFAKFVRETDKEIRPGDEVIVTHDGTVLAVGRAELPSHALADFDTGVAVTIREGAQPESESESDPDPKSPID